MKKDSNTVLSGMTNIGAASTPRNQSVKTHADIEDVIEKIECLRLVRGHRENKRCFDDDRTDDLGRSAERPTEFSDRRVSNDTIHRNEDEREEPDHGQGILIERGPIKSQLFSPTRDRPYFTTAELSRHSESNETFTIDYEKTAEEILRDKEYGEKLNACLDQLQDFEKTNWEYHSGVKVQNVCPVNGLTEELPLTSTIVEGGDWNDDALLLENVLCGAFQAARHATEDSFLPSPEGTEGTERTEGTEARFDPLRLSCSDLDPIASGSESHESSRTQSPAAAVFGSTESNTANLVTSFRVTAPSTYRPSQILTCSSSSSSSSSNQSFGDTTSPSSSNRTHFGQNYESCPILRQDRDVAATDGSVQDNIVDGDLWSKVVEELVNGFEEERAKMGGTDESYAYPNSIVERYGTSRSDEASIDVCAEIGRIAESLLPWSVAPYSAQTAETTNSREADRAFSPKDNDHGDFSSLFRSLGNASLSANDPGFEHDETRRSTTRTPDDFEIPKMVARFEARPRRRCNSDRCIIPWPSLNLPLGRASDRLKERLNPREVEKAMMDLLKRPVEELAKQDKDGDTTLMCLVGNPDELVRKMAYLVPLVERLSAITGALTVTNNRGEDALYMAAMNCPRYPYVAGYLAATMVEKGIDVGQRSYNSRGDTLIHSIAAQGDSRKDTLAELLALSTIRGSAVFDLSKRNYDGRTALHVAVESHQPLAGGTGSVATVKLLLKYGADPRIKETKCGDTALHMAVSSGCDPALVKVLLDASAFDLVNAINYDRDTPLHTAAAASNNVPLERLREVCWLLIHAGAQTNLLDRRGKTPLALVPSERKDAVRKIFYKRS